MGIETLRLEDIIKQKRPTLGGEVPVPVFRLLRLIGMQKILGESSGPTLYMVGKEIGSSLDVSTVEEFAKFIEEMKIGIPRILKLSGEKIVIRVDECVTCAGLPNIGEMVCHFEGGIIAGALEKILKRPTKAVQTKSHAAGFEYCEFDVLLY